VAPAAHGERLRQLQAKWGKGARVGIIPHAGHTLPRVDVPQEVAR
jgi:hypothetical protein